MKTSQDFAIYREDSFRPADWVLPAGHPAGSDQRPDSPVFNSLELCQLSVELAADEVFWMRPDSEVVYVNRSACERLGYRREELIGLRAWQWNPLLTPELWETHLEELRRHRCLHFDTQHRTKDGDVYPVEIKSHYFELDGQEFIFAYVLDISEQRAKEAALARYRDELEALVHARTLEVKLEKEKAEQTARQLEQSQREALSLARVKSNFLANMSHEIRTPMNGVMGMANALLHTQLDAAQQEQVQAILDCTGSLRAIIDDVLDLSRMESGNLVIESLSLDVWDCLHRVDQVTRQMAADKALELRIPERPASAPSYLGDGYRIQQVLVNLVGNAIKFTDSGVVEVSLDVSSVDDRHDVIQWSVRDTGIGISRERQSTLFERFTQADSSSTRRYGGSGLGLSICKQLVLLMGGEIGVHSEPGSGSTFWFRLPLEKDTRHYPVVPERPATPDFRDYAFDGARVLLVEDNEVNRKVACVALSHIGISADVARDGVEAVQMCADRRYDLVFMDCHLPNLDGYAATRQIRTQPGNEAVPVIALTANVLAEDKYRCINAGMTEILTKPFDFRDLAALMLRYLPDFAQRRAG
ncbi:response regulator [Mangrovimicrobium sediminis]|uniref:histidine kinase n=1 Tax=Mangrovimicrobium sediminis TaxID=2562682 RepID=A0A4Z0MA12_9GAMM|nr:ATP-binding protein [Haliea sp. SAOS-164]TGD76218.1 response regulator [Haliea sp. SAOS-164]